MDINGYKSPIDLCVEDFTSKIAKFENDQIITAVKAVVNVHEDELKKALEYDRNQYEVGYTKGYHDGYTQGTLDARNNIIDALNKLINEV